MAAPISRCLSQIFRSNVRQRLLHTSSAHLSAAVNQPRAKKSSGSVAAPQPRRERWRLMSAVCLERPPVITREMNELEREYTDLLEKLEYERSVLSDHELTHRDDEAVALKRKQDGFEESEGDLVRTTAVEWEDLWEEELKRFQPASRITEADTAGDLRSTERQLERKLILCLRQQLGSTSHWLLPMQPWTEGQSMREAAERALASLCGGNLRALFLGNAPCGYYKYKYPKELREKTQLMGDKVFFFKAQYLGGQVSLTDRSSVAGSKGGGSQSAVVGGDDKVVDFMWLTKDELQKYLIPAYHQRVQRFILDV